MSKAIEMLLHQRMQAGVLQWCGQASSCILMKHPSYTHTADQMHGILKHIFGRNFSALQERKPGLQFVNVI